MDSQKALSKFLDGYLQTAVPIEAVLEPVAASETCLDCGDVVQVDLNCQAAGCKRKRTKECATEMCFQCCFALKSSCSAHFRMRKKREAEDNFIEEGLRSSTRKKTSFYHYEEKFMRSDETIVIWCLQDFLMNPEWSADTMAQLQRGQRTEELMRRRGSQASELSCLSGTSAASASTSAVPSSPSSSPRSASSHPGRGSARKSNVGDAEGEGLLDMGSVGSPQVPSATKGRRGRKSTKEGAVEELTETGGEEPEPSPAKRARGGLTVANVAKRGARGTAVGSLRVATRQAIQGRDKRFEQVQEEWKRLLGL